MKTIEQRRARVERGKLDAHIAYATEVRAAVDAANRRLAEKITDLAFEAARIERGANDAWVLVREPVNGGPAVTVYHNAEGTCGLVRDLANYSEVPETDAVTLMGLTYCEACGNRETPPGYRRPVGAHETLQRAAAGNGNGAKVKVATK